ncbi:MAG: dTDP-4-dehydrorhamnose 3,5-epimerase family protein [Candidatus Micrarchaeia archaeon]
MINGVIIKKLDMIPDERGTILHMLRSDDPIFKSFGEIYFSTVYPGVVKGWHIHRRITQNYAVIQGMIKLVLYDDRPNSSTKNEIMELFIGEQNYQLVTIPPNVWNGFKGIGTKVAIVANLTTEPYDQNEIERVDPIENNIPYDWRLKWK